MELRIVSTLKGFYPLRGPWNRLREATASATVFQRHEYAAAWLKVFLDRARLHLIILEENGEVLGIAPFLRRGRRLTFLGTPHSDYNDLIVPPAFKTRFLAAILEHLKSERIKGLSLEQVPAASSTVPLFRDAGFIDRMQVRCPALTLKGREDVIRQQVLRKKSLRRHEAALLREGPLEFEHLGEAERILPLLDDFFRQHRERWLGTDTPSLFQQEENRRFYHELVRELSPTGSLVFTIVRWQGRAIAYHLGFEDQGRFFWYKPSFEPSLARRSPGEVLLKSLLERALDQGLEEFDFTRGLEPFKMRFADTVRTNRVLFMNKDLIYYRHLAASLVRRHPFLERTARRILRLASRL